MTGRLFRRVLIWLLITAGSWAYAQDERVPPARPVPTTSEPDEEEEARDADASADVFIPTEEISEDAAVPFPVDI